MYSIMIEIIRILVRFGIASVTAIVAVIIEKLLRDDLRDMKFNRIIGIVSCCVINVAIAITGDWVVSIMVGYIAGLAIVDYFTKEISNASVIMMMVSAIVINIAIGHIEIFEAVIIVVILIVVALGRVGLTDWAALTLCISYYKALYGTGQAMNFTIFSLVIFLVYNIIRANKSEENDMLGSIALGNAVCMIAMNI